MRGERVGDKVFQQRQIRLLNRAFIQKSRQSVRQLQRFFSRKPVGLFLPNQLCQQ